MMIGWDELGGEWGRVGLDGWIGYTDQLRSCDCKGTVMFGKMKDMASLMGQMKNMGAKAEELQVRLAGRLVEGESGAGAVKVVCNGKMEVQKIELDPSMIATLAGSGADADKALIEDLIAGAVNNALLKTRQVVKEEIKELTGGMNIPGLDNMLGGF